MHIHILEAIIVEVTKAENKTSVHVLDQLMYRKSGNLHYMKFLLEKFVCSKIFGGSTSYVNILTRKF